MKTSKKVNINKIYSKEDLEQEKFYDPPSSSSQSVIGVLSRPIEGLTISEYPNNKYTYIHKLSDGSASKLYIAKNNENNKEVVIKKINKYEEWRNELIVLNKLKNYSNRILTILDFYESERFAYVICDYHKSFDLFEHINLNFPYDEKDASKIIYNMLLCIKDCHDNGIAHLDIKFENFMVKDDSKSILDSQFILIDFGHAEFIESNLMKETYGSYGTSFYLCPEGYKNFFSMKSDIWSIGICSYLLLTGDFPFYGDDDDEYEESVMEGLPKLKEGLSEVSRNFILRCLDYNPKTRPNINQLLDDPFIKSL